MDCYIYMEGGTHAVAAYSDTLCAGQWCPAKGLFKIVYVAPTKALIQERVKDWSKRYGHLNMNIMECTGDSAEALDLTQADVIATTPYVTGGLSMESSKCVSAR